ncbi:hypothetical protein [Dokdonella sp.]|uniref:hypothetical protein n=1 Tax=Dokdonella sp. TaxID=2291710 RepID=UPI0025BD1F9D|nr:hypothetical protein [Dokdonella sp.]MBX3689567.1 hypothetical protein [Dokdonella sp.]
MANARTHFDFLSSYLQRYSEATRGTLAGRPCMSWHNTPFMTLFGQSVAFRLAGHGLVRALALPGASGFDPFKPDEPPPGKPGWVLVPATHWASWDRCALDAIRCLRLAQSQHVSWHVPPAPPEPPPAPPPSTPKSLAERVAAIMKSGFSFGLVKSDR